MLANYLNDPSVNTIELSQQSILSGESRIIELGFELDIELDFELEFELGKINVSLKCKYYCLFYKHSNNEVSDNFPKIPTIYFLKIPQNFPNVG